MTRHERKMRRNAAFERQELIKNQARERREREERAELERRREYERLHPVSSGLIPLVDYQPLR